MNNHSNNKTVSNDTIGLLVHSYNNYLSGLMGFTELALLECQQDIVKERLDMALESGSEAVIFGKELLSSIGRLQVALKPVDLIEITSLLKENIIIEYSNCQNDLKISTDKKWFVYCLESVIQFYRDYSKLTACDDIAIKVTISQSGSQVLLQILTDINFEQTQIENLFNLFYTSRTLLGKKNVGLAMVNGFIHQMKGTMTWQNNKGFLLTLPKG